MATAREEILGKLRNSRISVPEKPDFTESVFDAPQEPLEQAFKKALETVNGNVYLCSTESELNETLKQLVSRFDTKNIVCHESSIQAIMDQNNLEYSTAGLLPEMMEAGITGCEFIIAHTGTLMVSSAQGKGRQLFAYSPVHIVLAQKIQIVATLEDAWEAILNKYENQFPSQISLITGPSRTADIEKTLTLGAHGPKELHVLIH